MESIARARTTLAKLSCSRRKTQNPICEDRRDSFNYVELDIKLEQSIQRASKSQGDIVGQIRMFAVVMVLELILLIQTNCRKLTHERMMEHLKTIMYQEFRSTKAVIFDANISPVFLTLCELLQIPSLTKPLESDCMTSLPNI